MKDQSNPESQIVESNSRSIRGTFASLHNRDFLYLWLGLLTMFASLHMQMIARGYLAYEMTSSPLILGFVNAGFALPMLIFSLFGGAVADRFNRKTVILIGQAVIVITPLAITFLIYLELVQWYHLMIGSIFQGTGFTIMMPARQAIIPQIVGKANITNAMALTASAMSITTLMSPTIAGNLWAFVERIGGLNFSILQSEFNFGPAASVYVIISFFAIAAFFITAKMGRPPSVRKMSAEADNKPSGGLVADIFDGLKYIRNNRLVLILLVMGLTTTLLAMPYRFLLPVFVVDVYARGSDAYGWLVTLGGLGTMVGSLFISWLGAWKRGLLLILGSLVSAIGLIMLAAFPFYLAALGIMVFLGLGDAGRRTLNQALIMSAVEDGYQARVMSVFMLNFGLMPLGVLPASIAMEYWGSQEVIAVLGILLLVVTGIIFFTQKQLRGID